MHNTEKIMLTDPVTLISYNSRSRECAVDSYHRDFDPILRSGAIFDIEPIFSGDPSIRDRLIVVRRNIEVFALA